MQAAVRLENAWHCTVHTWDRTLQASLNSAMLIGCLGNGYFAPLLRRRELRELKATERVPLPGILPSERIFSQPPNLRPKLHLSVQFDTCAGNNR